MPLCKAIVIVGTGASAQVVRSSFEEIGVTVLAFAADREFCKHEEIYGKRLVPLDDLRSFFPLSTGFHVAVGYNAMNALRSRLLARMKELGFTACSFISPAARISKDAELGEHCYVGDFVSIQPFAVLGSDCTVLSGSTVGHHSVVNAHSYICQHSNLNGYVRVGGYSFIGAGSTLLDGVELGQHSFVGACAKVGTSMGDDCFYNPSDNKVYSNGSIKFAKWFNKRQQYYALHNT